MFRIPAATPFTVRSRALRMRRSVSASASAGFAHAATGPTAPPAAGVAGRGKTPGSAASVPSTGRLPSRSRPATLGHLGHGAGVFFLAPCRTGGGDPLAPAPSTYISAMPRSVLASVISTLDRKVWKKVQSLDISASVSSNPAARAAAKPDPTPNQPGMICRLWVQPKTHGMARGHRSRSRRRYGGRVGSRCSASPVPPRAWTFGSIAGNLGSSTKRR